MEKCHEIIGACEALSKNTAASGIFMHNAAVVFIEQDCTRPGHHTMQTERHPLFRVGVCTHEMIEPGFNFFLQQVPSFPDFLRFVDPYLFFVGHKAGTCIFDQRAEAIRCF